MYHKVTLFIILLFSFTCVLSGQSYFDAKGTTSKFEVLDAWTDNFIKIIESLDKSSRANGDLKYLAIVDENFIPFFGKKYSQLSNDDYKKINKIYDPLLHGSTKLRKISDKLDFSRRGNIFFQHKWKSRNLSGYTIANVNRKDIKDKLSKVMSFTEQRKSCNYLSAFPLTPVNKYYLYADEQMFFYELQDDCKQMHEEDRKTAEKIAFEEIESEYRSRLNDVYMYEGRDVGTKARYLANEINRLKGAPDEFKKESESSLERLVHARYVFHRDNDVLALTQLLEKNDHEFLNVVRFIVEQYGQNGVFLANFKGSRGNFNNELTLYQDLGNYVDVFIKNNESFIKSELSSINNINELQTFEERYTKFGMMYFNENTYYVELLELVKLKKQAINLEREQRYNESLRNQVNSGNLCKCCLDKPLSCRRCLGTGNIDEFRLFFDDKRTCPSCYRGHVKCSCCNKINY